MSLLWHQQVLQVWSQHQYLACKLQLWLWLLFDGTWVCLQQWRETLDRSAMEDLTITFLFIPCAFHWTCCNTRYEKELLSWRSLGTFWWWNVVWSINVFWSWPVKSYWWHLEWRLERQETPRKGFRGFWGFWGVWRLANGRLECQEKVYWWHLLMAPCMAPWTPRKSCWCGLSALACRVKLERHATKQPRPAGSRVPKKPLEGFGGFWGVLKVFEAFDAWQTAGLNASKKLLMAPFMAPWMAPWTPRKRCWCGLSALACGVKLERHATKQPRPGGSRVPKEPLESFGGFWGVWGVWRLANGRLERQ